MSKKNQDSQNQLSRRNFFTVATGATVGLGATSLKASDDKLETSDTPLVKPEWRNKVETMSYRQLGRTGMMVSEVVCGGDPVRNKNYKHIDIALDRGLNYLDMAPQYGKGECEEAYSKIIDSSSKRQKVFMTTKVSGFAGIRDAMYQDIYKALPSEKQNAILAKAQELREARYVDKPGYFLMYWPGQDKSMDKCYISNAMMKDHGHKVDGSKKYISFIKSSLEGSLKRVKTDHFDILMCPHGANSPEEVSIPEIYSTFSSLKKEGKVRFLGVSSHNDPAGVLKTVADSGQYDMAMVAYNVINGGYMEEAIKHASSKGMGIIAMKAAMAVATHHKTLQPTPEWRVKKVERIVPGNLKAPLKAYLWVLQNPNISAVISNLWDEQFINENLSIVGTKVELQAG